MPQHSAPATTVEGPGATCQDKPRTGESNECTKLPQCKRLRAREALQPPTQDTGDHIDAAWLDINAYWKTLRLPKSKRRLRWMTAGEAPEVEAQLPPLRLSNAEFIEAMSARQNAIDAQCLNIRKAMEEQRYEDTGAMYMFDMQQKHDPVQEGAKELKRMITRSATLRAFWRRYNENNGIFVWQEVTEERALVGPFAHHGAMSYVQPVFN